MGQGPLADILLLRLCRTDDISQYSTYSTSVSSYRALPSVGLGRWQERAILCSMPMSADFPSISCQPARKRELDSSSSGDVLTICAVLQVPLPAAEPVRSKCGPADATARVFLSAGNADEKQGRPKPRSTGSEQVFIERTSDVFSRLA